MLALAFAVWVACFTVIHVLPESPAARTRSAAAAGRGVVDRPGLDRDCAARARIFWRGSWAGWRVSTVVLVLVLSAPADLKWLRRYKYTWLLVGLVLLALTFIVGVNPEGAGLTLWLGGRWACSFNRPNC